MVRHGAGGGLAGMGAKITKIKSNIKANVQSRSHQSEGHTKVKSMTRSRTLTLVHHPQPDATPLTTPLPTKFSEFSIGI